MPSLAVRDLVYGDRFYDDVDPASERLYARLADAIVDIWAPRTVVDVGCGTGFMLARLAERGADVQGIEGSRAAIRRGPPEIPIVRANLEHGVPQLGTFDVCLCIEVAEHLRARTGPRLVEGLTRLSNIIVFTAAQPGQQGRAHVNTQPKSYWSSLFREHGFVPSTRQATLADAISGVPEPSYIHPNLMVFERELNTAVGDLGVPEVEAREEDAIVLVEHDRARGRAKPKLAHELRSRSARNQRRRSSHGTAAFAGEVDGSTKSAVSYSLGSCNPCSTRPPKTPV